MRTGLQKVDGVNKVDVSLEKGNAAIELKPGNKATLAELQTVVKKNGFSPKGARVKLKGKVNDNQVIISGSNESVPAILSGQASEKEGVIIGSLEIQKDSQTFKVTSIQ